MVNLITLKDDDSFKAFNNNVVATIKEILRRKAIVCFNPEPHFGEAGGREFSLPHYFQKEARGAQDLNF